MDTLTVRVGGDFGDKLFTRVNSKTEAAKCGTEAREGTELSMHLRHTVFGLPLAAGRRLVRLCCRLCTWGVPCGPSSLCTFPIDWFCVLLGTKQRLVSGNTVLVHGVHAPEAPTRGDARNSSAGIYSDTRGASSMHVHRIVRREPKCMQALVCE